MLQINQIEKPRCSATIDQIRLRWAMALPSDFQNFSSSGFQSAIHREFPLLIEESFLKEPRRSTEAKSRCAGRFRVPAAAALLRSVLRRTVRGPHDGTRSRNHQFKSRARSWLSVIMLQKSCG